MKDDAYKIDDFEEYLSQLNDYKKERIQIVNPERLCELQTAFDILKIIAKGKNIDISYKLNQDREYPFNSVSSVIVTGNIIEISSCGWFSKVSKLASNICVAPMANGKVEYILTFHNSMLTLDEK